MSWLNQAHVKYETVTRSISYKHPNYTSVARVSMEDGPPYWMSIWTDVRCGFIGNDEVRVREWRPCEPSKTSDFVEVLMKELSDWTRASSHRNVAPFVGICKGIFPWPALITPYFERGNIMEFLSSHPQFDPMPLLIQVADALVFMHGLQPPVFHRFVRGSNIMISREKEARLIDLCLGELLYHPAIQRDKSDFRRYRWMSPEMCTAEDAGGLKDPSKCDVYSFGVTMFEVLSGQEPYADNLNPYTALYATVSGKIPERPMGCARITDELWQLMEKCWVTDPEERYTMSQVYDELIKLYPHARLPGLPTPRL